MSTIARQSRRSARHANAVVAHASDDNGNRKYNEDPDLDRQNVLEAQADFLQKGRSSLPYRTRSVVASTILPGKYKVDGEYSKVVRRSKRSSVKKRVVQEDMVLDDEGFPFAMEIQHPKNCSCARECAELVKKYMDMEYNIYGGCYPRKVTYYCRLLGNKFGLNSSSIRRAYQRLLVPKEKDHGNQLLVNADEESIVNLIVDMRKRGRPVGRDFIINLARNMIGRGPSWSGLSWFYGFVHRHHEVLGYGVPGRDANPLSSKRKPQDNSTAPARENCPLCPNGSAHAESDE